MYRLKKLPYKKEFSSIEIYKYLSDANYSIGELKGLLDSTKYLGIILKLINLLEAKSSSDIANIKTSYKDLFLDSIAQKKTNSNSEQVVNHLRATNILYWNLVKKNKLLISDINSVQELVFPDDIGIRLLRGHKIYNKITNEVLYIPPQNKSVIEDYYQNLIDYINTKESKYDPLIKMAISHYQFECIHPYKKGNGRIGRIINIMSLIQAGRLQYPILNLCKYFNETKEKYFYLLEKCHNDINFLDEFIIYVLKGIYETSNYTINFTHQLVRVIENTKASLIKKLANIYSEELLIHIFKYPYTKNELLRMSLNLSRSTSTKYLKLLVENGFLEEEKYGKEVVYKNIELSNLF